MECIPFFSGICAILAQANLWDNLSAAGGILLGGKAGSYRSSEKTDFYPQGARLSFLRKQESVRLGAGAIRGVKVPPGRCPLPSSQR
jgi:glutamine amidotransferase-like uncharacterized protein